MILVVAGTKEGREIVNLLTDRGFKVMLAAYTDYGQELAKTVGEERFAGELTAANLNKFLVLRKVRLVVDASNPFDIENSQMVYRCCETLQIPYLRYVREKAKIPDDPLVHLVNSWEEGAAKAFALGDTVFLTTGSNNLEIFLKHPQAAGKRIVVRVLPEHKIIKKCQDLGLRPKDIVAMQGPFSKEMNRLMFKAFKASVVVIKESGQAGGTDNKIAAALALKIPVVVIARPTVKWGQEVRTYPALLEMVTKKLKGEVDNGKTQWH